MPNSIVIIAIDTSSSPGKPNVERGIVQLAATAGGRHVPGQAPFRVVAGGSPGRAEPGTLLDQACPSSSIVALGMSRRIVSGGDP